MTMTQSLSSSFFFFFNDTATTEIYTLSLHDALPIFIIGVLGGGRVVELAASLVCPFSMLSMRYENAASEKLVSHADRKSTRLNSSHSQISYAVFCLKKKKKAITAPRLR